MRVLVCHQQAIVRLGLRAIIQQEYEASVVAEAANADDILDAVQHHRPEILLIDRHLWAHVSDAELPGTVIQIVLVGRIDTEELLQIIKAGARGVVEHDASPGHVAAAIDYCYQGLGFISPSFTAALMDIIRDTPPRLARYLQYVAPIGNTLTPREGEILERLCEGMSNRAIAIELYLSEKTIKFHVSNILTKLNVRTRAEAVAYTRRAINSARSNPMSDGGRQSTLPG